MRKKEEDKVEEPLEPTTEPLEPEEPVEPEPGLEPSAEEPPPVEEPPAVDPYAGTDLEGKTDEERAHLYRLQQGVADRLRRDADEKYERELPPPEPKEIAPEEFWLDPIGNMRELIRSEMALTVEPFKRDQAEARAGQVFERFRSNTVQYPDFAELEPYIRHYIESNQGDPSNENIVHWAYLAARGSRGLPGGPPASAVQPTEETTVVTRPGPTAPPQHRPSSAPLEEKVEKKRPLTEEEREVAKAQGLTHDQYRKYRDEGHEDERGRGTIVMERED